MGAHRFVIDGTEYEVTVGTRAGNRVSVTVNGKGYDVELASPAAVTPRIATQPAPSAAPTVPAVVPAAPSAARPAPAAPEGAPGEVRAPIAGLVLRIDVSPGEKVTAGTILLVLEAMKMENEIFAPCDGEVQAVHVQPQQEVEQGTLLVTLAAG